MKINIWFLILFFIWSCNVFSQTPVTIGNGEESARIPFDFWWRSNLYETLYYPQEMQYTGNIDRVTFYHEDYPQDFPMPLKLWLGITNQSDLSQGWIPSGELTLVYDQEVAIQTGHTELDIPFNNAFNYAGGNLVMLAYHHHTYYSVFNVPFAAQTMQTDRARRYYGDAVDPDPANPSVGGTLSRQIPQTTFWINPSGVINSDDCTDLPCEPTSVMCYPNPFRDFTDVAITYDKSTIMEVSVYNTKGQKVRNYSDYPIQPGKNRFRWDGIDNTGNHITPGVYFITFRNDGMIQTKRVLCIR